MLIMHVNQFLVTLQKYKKKNQKNQKNGAEFKNLERRLKNKSPL
jgi:hypothetical protein